MTHPFAEPPRATYTLGAGVQDRLAIVRRYRMLADPCGGFTPFEGALEDAGGYGEPVSASR